MKVLVVDDDIAIRRLLDAYLSRAGYQVILAQDGQEALRLIREHKPPLAVVDWSMPVMDGLELCRAVRQEPGLGFIYLVMLTAHEDDEAGVVRALEAGADDFMVKPVQQAKLLARLRVGERIQSLEAQRREGQQIENERNRLRDAVTAMDQVLGVVAHELRTPLAGMRAMAEFMLLPQAREMAEWDMFLRNLPTELTRLSGLVDNLLEAARLKSGAVKWHWGDITVARLAAEALDVVRPLVNQAKVKLHWDVEPQEMAMRGDEDAIRRLLVNLVGNACRHTADGSVTIVSRRTQRGDGNWVELSVTDTGRGIAPALAEKLGEAFAVGHFFGAMSVHGSGLGLSICKGIAAAHGGRLRIESELGKGTTVTAILRADLLEATAVAPMEIERRIAA